MQNKLFVILVSLFIISQAESQIVWNLTIDVASTSFGNNHPRIVKDNIGNPLVIWGKSNNVKFSRWNGTGFTNPINLNINATSIAEASWMGPDIAAHGDTVYVVFKQTPESSNSSHIWCVHSYDGGRSFSSPIQVDSIADSLSRFPTITTDDLGNPIIGFMKFDPFFGNPRWVVSRSIDYGNTFLTDVLASGWSSSTSEVCDCCPGAIASLGSKVAMLYRGNDNNIRDNWAGISNDFGNTFKEGMDIDQQNWKIFACPSSGPDGVILGDTLYSTYMSGASGMSRVYFNKSSLSEVTGSTGNLLTNDLPGLGQQNFPRITSSGNAMGIAWKQVVNGKSQLSVLFTDNITSGFSSSQEIIAESDVTNTDLILTPENIFVVWQDDKSGTVKFRSGKYYTPTLTQEKVLIGDLSAYPNPSSEAWTIKGYSVYPTLKVELFTAQGILINTSFIQKSIGFFLHEIQNLNLVRGLYIIKFSHNDIYHSMKLLKQ